MCITITKDATIGQNVRIVCERCQQKTNHIVAASIEVTGFEEDIDFHWETIYQIVRCQGCDTCSFRIQKRNSESWSPARSYTEVVYPKRSQEIITCKDIYGLPNKVQQLYHETIECYNNDLPILCAVGVRALVEAICLDKNIKDGPVDEKDALGNITQKRKKNLEGKINGLFEIDILTKENAAALHEHRFLGNEAAHKISAPQKHELSLAIRIIETILESIYGVLFKSRLLKQART
jgi:hypothetical protein